MASETFTGPSDKQAPMAIPSPVRQRPTVDPIDTLVPPLWPWWIRLSIATVVISVVAFVGWAWHAGVVRPAPDCCGGDSWSPSIGLSNRPDAVTIAAYFFNSSHRAVTITAADADLPGAQLIEIRPYEHPDGWEMPPQDLGSFPWTLGGGDGIWLAVSFEPQQCSATDDVSEAGDLRGDWGTLTFDLTVAGDQWLPTIGRRYQRPLVYAGPNQLDVLQPSSLDGAFDGIVHPMEIACRLLQW